MNVSIVIPSYNSENTIERCLLSALNQQTDSEYEIIVVDSSPHNKVKEITNKFNDIKFTKLKKRVYPGIARNTGAEQAHGELLLFLDSDIVVAQDVVERATNYYKNGHEIFSGALIAQCCNGINILNKLELFLEFSEFKPNMEEGQRWCLPTAFLAIKKSLTRENKFLDMKTSEDTELTVKLRHKGHVLYFTPSIEIIHNSSTTFFNLIVKAFDFGIDNMRIRKLYNISGSWGVKNIFFGSLIIPFFAVIKFLKICWRNIRYNKSLDKLLYILLIPAISILITSWMVGFYKGLYSYDK